MARGMKAQGKAYSKQAKKGIATAGSYAVGGALAGAVVPYPGKTRAMSASRGAGTGIGAYTVTTIAKTSYKQGNKMYKGHKSKKRR